MTLTASKPEADIRVMILCYDFPPYPSVGARRPYYWYNILPQYGVHPVVITRNWDQAEWNAKSYYTEDRSTEEIISTEQRTLIKVPLKKRFKNQFFKSDSGLAIPFRKLWTAFDLFTRWSASFNDDYHFIFQAAAEYLSQNKVDLIIATGEPFVLFKHAAALGKKFNTAWVPDYRDGWSTNHSLDSLNGIHSYRIKQEQEQERKLLASSASFLTVNDKILKQNEAAFPGSKGYEVGNGIDFEQYNSPVARNSANFRILYTGHLYPKHDVSRFLEGYAQFLKENPAAKIEVCFVGITLRPCVHTEDIERYILMYPERIKIVQPVKHEEAVHLQRTSDMLLKFNFMPQSQGFLGAKMYEYAASRRPILTIPSDQDRETTFFPGRDIQSFALNSEEVKQNIEHWYSRFEQNQPTSTSLTDEELFEISVQAQIKKLALVLKQLTKQTV